MTRSWFVCHTCIVWSNRTLKLEDAERCGRVSTSGRCSLATLLFWENIPQWEIVFGATSNRRWNDVESKINDNFPLVHDEIDTDIFSTSDRHCWVGVNVPPIEAELRGLSIKSSLVDLRPSHFVLSTNDVYSGKIFAFIFFSHWSISSSKNLVYWQKWLHYD